MNAVSIRSLYSVSILLFAFCILYMYGIFSNAEVRLLPAAAVQMTPFTASKHCRFVSIKVELIWCVRLYNWQGNAIQQDKSDKAASCLKGAT